MSLLLALLRLIGQYTIDKDVCDTQVGCVLLQELKDKVLKLVGYLHRSLCDAGTRYETTLKVS